MEQETKLNLISNGPVVDNERYDTYVKELNEKVLDKNVYNIGIIGPYGSGKSSLIETYKNNYWNGHFKKKKITTISLATFNDDSSKKEPVFKDAVNEYDNKAKVGDIDSNIEKGILEQFIYKVGKNKVPSSRINRISTNHGLFSIILSFLLTAIIALVCCSVMELYGNLPYSDGSNFYYFFAASIISVIIFVFLLFYLNKINKIAVKDIEAQFCECPTGSILNSFIDEVLYYFKKTKVEVVVIEDLDRFNSVNIFSKLRELNYLINNSEIVKHKVTFIYAVKDGLFKDKSDRVKFFDVVISLIPVMSFVNSRDMLKQEIKKLPSYMTLSDKYIHEISFFISEMRILKNIINDYKVYYELLNISELSDSDKSIKLFSLMVYKNIKPEDYALLQEGNGILAQIFKRKNDIINQKINQLNEELQNLQNEKEFIEREYWNSIDILKKTVIGFIVSSGVRNSSLQYKNVSQISSFLDDSVTGYSYTVNGYTYCRSKSEIEKCLGNSLKNIEKNIQEKSSNKQKDIDEKIIELNRNKKDIYNFSIAELLVENPDIFDEILTKDNGIIRYLLTCGYIDETYKDYISFSGQEILTAKDADFIRKVISKQAVNADEKLDNPYMVISNIGMERFTDRYVLNYSLFVEFLKNEKGGTEFNEKSQKMFEYLSSRTETAKSFLSAYLESENDLSLLISKKELIYPYFCYDVLTNNSITGKSKDCLIQEIFRYGKLELFNTQNVEYVLRDYLTNHDNPIDTFLSPNSDIAFTIQVLKALGVKLKSLSCKDLNEENLKKLIGEILSESLYQINQLNMDFILGIYYNKDEKYKVSLISSLLNIGNDSIINYIKENIDTVLSIVLQIDQNCQENENTIQFILNNKSISIDRRKEFIGKLSAKFDYFEGIEPQLLQCAYDNNKIVASWDNIVKSVTKKLVTLASIAKYIEDNAESLKEDKLDNKSLVLQLCNEKLVSNSTIEKLSKSFVVKLKTNEIKDDEQCAILVKGGVIDVTEENVKAAISKPKTLAQFFIIEPEFINTTQLNEQIIDKLLMEDEFPDQLKASLINAKNTYIPKDDKIKEIVASIIIKIKIDSCTANLLSSLIDSQLIDNKIKCLLLEQYHDVLSDGDLLEKLSKINPAFETLELGVECTIHRTQVDDREIKLLEILKNREIFNCKKYKEVIKLKPKA